MNWMLFILIGFLFTATPATAVGADSSATPGMLLELEGGAVWQSRNDVQIPNDATATRFSLVDAVGNGPWPAARFYATLNLREKHSLRLLLAPLSVTETGVLDAPVDFVGSKFAAGIPTKFTYKFNSWRIGYRYRFHDSKDWRWWIGFTANIRDAKIRLNQGDMIAEKADVGFVPLLSIAGTWRIAPQWTAELDLEALAGGAGRAEDAALKLRYHIDDRWSIAGGYRTVEGGSDVDAVYNFAWLHYAVVSVGLAF